MDGPARPAERPAETLLDVSGLQKWCQRSGGRSLEVRLLNLPYANLTLTPAFAAAAGKQAQWAAFIRKVQLTDAPGELATVISELAAFLVPVSTAVAATSDFTKVWQPPETWK